MNKPGKKDKYIIYEGQTEEKFIKKLQIIFENNFNIYLIDAKGKDKIINEYKKVKKKNHFSEVALMYDLDCCNNVNNIIKNYRENNLNITKSEIYFINPQFEILFVLVKEEKTPVDRYKLYIKRLYGVENYEKNDQQLDRIINQISKEEMTVLITRIDRLMSNSDVEIRSTNYNKLFTELFKIR